METSRLKKFAQYARRYLIEQVSARLELVLSVDSAARRENPKAVQELERKIQEISRNQIVEQIAYVWFNRFCALRFMDVNRYTRIGTVSPVAGQFQPEILAEAKSGHIDEDMVPEKVREKVYSLLNGKAPSKDPQAEAYNLLLVAVCNYYNRIMPFLFERIADYTELLMPDDLLSGNSILAYTREAMTPDVCEDVEVIGWLYQFYISEKKDEVFEGLKENKKITPENIPAATQVFTPRYIVRYLVENSLGRLWVLNRPNSQLEKRMAYYIEPEEPETDFLRIKSPEEIKICDPACGSGHMLVYAFDLLYAIYEEEGYEPSEIPGTILTHNLYGIEIDERAGELAAFALTMKAQGKYRRFLRKPIQPNICILENIRFKEGEIKNYLDAVGRDLFTTNLQTTLSQFEEADNFGSLIRPALSNVKDILRLSEARNIVKNMFLQHIHERVLKVLRQADFLSPKYHVVIANPPYMGNRSLNGRLQVFAKDSYPESKSDLFAMFIERNLDLAQRRGLVAMITMQSWMFLSSYENFRTKILNANTILSMAHLGARAFDSIGGEVVSATAFIIANFRNHGYKGSYVGLTNGNSESEKEEILRVKRKYPYTASSTNFNKISGSPIVYWASERILEIFASTAPLSKKIETREGLTTGSNDLFLRLWHEVQISNIAFNMKDNTAAIESKKRWFTYVKGGSFRKWYGNYEYLVNWHNDGEDLKLFVDPETGRIRSHNYNGSYAFRSGFTWSGISSSNFAVRHVPIGFMFDAKGPMGYVFQAVDQKYCEAFLNSNVTNHFLKMLAPTLDFKLGHILNLPFKDKLPSATVDNATNAYLLSCEDWNSYETSWDFANYPLLSGDYRQPALEKTYSRLRDHWHEMTLELQQLEQKINKIFIEAYGLHDELGDEVPLSEVTLTCNPQYRYGNNKSEEELEALLLADTMKEFMSYAVGCMFGRYSLDKPGLVLANQGETFEDYLEQVPNPAFPPDKDNVIPMLDGDWFPDDICEQFRKFLRVTFGEDHYEENLKFLEDAIGKDIRKYFLKDFYNDHIRRYKKRPIYWLFSSPKGAFSALIYMHRYRPDTVGVVLNDYLREFRSKLVARKGHLEQVSISGSTSPSEKTKALKEIEKLGKMIKELEDYEREVLYPLATKQVEIDLDDGVKVNYAKFGAALKKIPGLDVKEED
ncbi:MAG: BREX-1 system adenine-specific DNA-methyltransferase PglX [Syntrophobacteraceae bacterium]